MICSLVLVLSRSLSLPHTYINYKINNILFCILSVSALVERYCFCCVEYYFAWYLWIRDLHCGHQWASFYKIWKKKKKGFLPFHTKARMQRWVSSNTGVVEACRVTLPAKCEQQTENTRFESRAAPLASRTVEALTSSNTSESIDCWLFYFTFINRFYIFSRHR